MADVLFIEYPKCSPCKKAKEWLDAHGVAYADRHIVEDNPTSDELAAWHAKSGLPLRRFFNTSGMLYRERNVKALLDAGMSDADAYALLAENGMPAGGGRRLRAGRLQRGRVGAGAALARQRAGASSHRRARARRCRATA